MSAHTPGPWAWDDEGGELFASRGASAGTTILWPRNISAECDARRDGWASALGSHNASDEESAANARLIAAAPKLLAACRTALTLRQLGGMLPGVREIVQVVVDEAEAAIAEAAGSPS